MDPQSQISEFEDGHSRLERMGKARLRIPVRGGGGGGGGGGEEEEEEEEEGEDEFFFLQNEIELVTSVCMSS